MRIAIIGFGSQAKAWSLNLKDSGANVYIALRELSPSLEEAKKLGLKTITLGRELLDFQHFVLLTPDSTHAQILKTYQPFFPKGSKIILAHGYSLLKDSLNEMYPLWDFLLLAPKAIASEVRFQFETKGKLAAVFSVEVSSNPQLDTDLLKGIATSLGITAGPYVTSFKEETYADLFSEQSILCSLIPYGALNSYNKLRKKGISPEVAYLECWYEVKLISDTLIKLGPQKFFDLISPNALIGAEKAKAIILGSHFENGCQELLEDIWSGKFFQEVDKTDFNNIKHQVQRFWKDQELSLMHEKLSKELF